MNRQFYVYLHCKPDGMPFYVGKGVGRRAYVMGRQRSVHHQNIVKKYGFENIGIFVFPSESEESALEEEIHAISSLRGQGIDLVNMTIGGDGSSGMKHSPETRAKMSSNRLGIAIFSGKKHTAESREKISASLREAYKESPRPPAKKKPMVAKTCAKCSTVYDGRACPPCKKEYSRQYQIKNSSLLYEKAKKRAAENPDIEASRRRDYYEKNKEKIKADSALWAQENRSRANEIARKYRAKLKSQNLCSHK